MQPNDAALAAFTQIQFNSSSDDRLPGHAAYT